MCGARQIRQAHDHLRLCEISKLGPDQITKITIQLVRRARRFHEERVAFDAIFVRQTDYHGIADVRMAQNSVLFDTANTDANDCGNNFHYTA